MNVKSFVSFLSLGRSTCGATARLRLSAVLLLAGVAAPVGAQTNAAPRAEDFLTRARRLYLESRDRYQHEATNAEVAWQFERACFDLAVLAADNTERAEIAQKGIDAGRSLVARRPNLAPAHYYLGMNIGELADTKRNLSGLKMVKDMEHEFEAARQLDERLDYAGPDRNLGLLYWQAPSIISIGSRSKARQHLQRAVELAPDYPENRLNLIEAYLKWGERPEASRELRELEKVLPAARKRFSGDDYAASWVDWENRLNALRKKFPESNFKVEPK